MINFPKKKGVNCIFLVEPLLNKYLLTYGTDVLIFRALYKSERQNYSLARGCSTTVCPRSLDPFYIVTYPKKNQTCHLGHTVDTCKVTAGSVLN